MIDFETLKDIVLENDYFSKSPTIQKIFNYIRRIKTTRKSWF